MGGVSYSQAKRLLLVLDFECYDDDDLLYIVTIKFNALCNGLLNRAMTNVSILKIYFQTSEKIQDLNPYNNEFGPLKGLYC